MRLLAIAMVCCASAAADALDLPAGWCRNEVVAPRAGETPEKAIERFLISAGGLEARGRGKEALAEVCNAFQVASAGGLPPRELQSLTAGILNGFAVIFRNHGRPQEALIANQKSLELRRAVGDRAAEAVSLHNLGHVLADLGRLEEGGALLEEAVLLRRQLRLDQPLGESLNVLGVIYDSLDALDRAEQLYREALTIALRVRAPSLEGAALQNIGNLYLTRRQYPDAIKYLERARVVLEAERNLRGLSHVNHNVAAAYVFVGQPARALPYIERAAAIEQELEDWSALASSHQSRARALDALGRTSEALESLIAARDLRLKVGDLRGLGETINGLARFAAAAGRVEDAEALYQEALSLRRKMQDVTGEAVTLSNIGALKLRRSDSRAAREYFERAEALMKTAPDAVTHAANLSMLASTMDAPGERERGLALHRQAVDLLESARATAVIDELKQEMLDNYQRIYQVAVAAHLAAGDKETAFEIIEKARARLALEQLSRRATSAPSQRSDRDDALVARINALSRELAIENAKPVTTRDPARVETLAQGAEAARAEWTASVVRLKAENVVRRKDVAVLTLAQIQRTLSPGTLLISYFFAGDRPVAYVVSRERAEAIALEPTTAEIEAFVRAFRAAGTSDPSSVARLLYEALVMPLEKHLGGGTRVIIVPHGILNYLPFAALYDGRAFLVERLEIEYVPSASTLAFLPGSTGPLERTPLILANAGVPGFPYLSGAERETSDIAALLKTTARQGTAATRERFFAAAGRASLIHIAAHGELNEASPEFSRLMLSADEHSDGALHAHEIAALDLTSRPVVVLSACQSNVGRLTRGDELIGLNRAFLAAGASSIIASLWTVEDGSTAELMLDFHRALHAGHSPAKALQSAMLAARERQPHPYFWAGFVVTGNPSVTP